MWWTNEADWIRFAGNSAIGAAKKAKEKRLAVVAGTQRRHQQSYLDTIKRIHDGDEYVVGSHRSKRVSAHCVTLFTRIHRTPEIDRGKQWDEPDLTIPAGLILEAAAVAAMSNVLGQPVERVADAHAVVAANPSALDRTLANAGPAFK